ncbi:hypothetical protein [Kitasatospora sp. NPDC004289]
MSALRIRRRAASACVALALCVGPAAFADTASAAVPDTCGGEAEDYIGVFTGTYYLSGETIDVTATFSEGLVVRTEEESNQSAYVLTGTYEVANYAGVGDVAWYAPGGEFVSDPAVCGTIPGTKAPTVTRIPGLIGTSHITLNRTA